MPNSSERLELARRLHDGLAQELAALGYAMDALIADPRLVNELRGDLRTLRLRLIDINANFRDEIYLLRHLTFASLEQGLRDLFPHARLLFQLSSSGLSPRAEDAIARALLEIGRNSAQHSGCTAFSINGRDLGGHLEIVALDNGNGNVSIRQRSYGLASITEHLDTIGAEVECTADQAGTRYTVRYKFASDNP